MIPQLLTISISLLLFAGDDSKVRRPERDRPLVAALWSHHEGVILAVLHAVEAGGSIDQAEFSAAVEFFEASTGIPSGTETTFGRLPMDSLARVNGQWEEWYSLNRSRLYFDSGGCRLRVEENDRK